MAIREFLPRAICIAFADHPLQGDDSGSLAVVDLAGNKKMLTSQWFTIQGLAWSPDGKEIWFTAGRYGTDRTLYATTLDGKPRIVARLPGALILLDIAKDGRVLLVRADWRRELLGVFAGDPKQHELSWLDYTYPADLSSDGKTLLFDEEGGGGALDYSKSSGLTYAVYIRKTDGSPAVLLGEGGAVALSPDGKWAISQTQDSPSQFKILPTGAGEPRDLTKDNINHSWAHWFPDGKRILFTADEPGKGVRFYVYDLASGKSQAVSQEGVNGTAFSISPDRNRSRPLARTRRDICIPWLAANRAPLPASIRESSPSPGRPTGVPCTSTNRESFPPAFIASTCKPASARCGRNSSPPTPPASRTSARS